MVLGYSGHDYFKVYKCAECGKDVIVTHQMMINKTYIYSRKGNLKKNYCCSWSCYRKFKYKDLMKKARLTEADRAWLRYARFT